MSDPPTPSQSAVPVKTAAWNLLLWTSDGQVSPTFDVDSWRWWLLKIIHSVLMIFAILSLSLVLSRRLQLFIYLWWTSQKKYFIFDKRKLIGSRRMGKSDSPQLDWSLECGLMCDLGMWGTTWHQAEKNHKDLFFAPRWCWHDNSHLFVNCD